MSSVMLTRIIVGVHGGGGVHLYQLRGTNGLPFALGVALFSMIGAHWNSTGRFAGQGGEPSEFLGCLACVVFQYAAWTHNGAEFAPYLPALLMLLVITTLLMELSKRRPKPIVTIGTTFLGAVYVGWLFSYLTLLHGMQPGMIRLNGASEPLLGSAVRAHDAGRVAGDFCVRLHLAVRYRGALFAGKAFGRHKLAPNISPGKTWEGSIGGLLTAVAAGALLGHWLHLPMVHALVLSFSLRHGRASSATCANPP